GGADGSPAGTARGGDRGVVPAPRIRSPLPGHGCAAAGPASPAAVRGGAGRRRRLREPPGRTDRVRPGVSSRPAPGPAGLGGGSAGTAANGADGPAPPGDERLLCVAPVRSVCRLQLG